MASPRRPRRGASASDEPRSKWRIEDVLARTDLETLLNEIAQPATHTTRGQRWHCPVQDHDDANASVTTHTDRRGHERWRCWSSGDAHRGDAVDLVKITQGMDQRDAVEWLANRAGMIPDQPLPPPRPPKITPRPAVVPLQPDVVRYAMACEKILWSRGGEPVRDWLAARGLSPEIVHANHIGADPGRHKLPRPKGLPYGQTPGATFPALDQAGQIRYLQTRYLEPSADGPKYDNPSARMGSNPRLAWTATVDDPRPGQLIVCEGIPDALIAAQEGWRSVAVLGAQAPDSTLAARLAARADQDQLTIHAICDNDKAGRTWGERLADLLAEHDHTPTITTPPTPGTDLTDWALDDPAWSSQIDDATPARSAAEDQVPGVDHPSPTDRITQEVSVETGFTSM